VLRSQEVGTIVVHQRLNAGRAMTLSWTANRPSSTTLITIAWASPLSGPISIDFGTR
jgi:hypothetical protein